MSLSVYSALPLLLLLLLSVVNYGSGNLPAHHSIELELNQYEPFIPVNPNAEQQDWDLVDYQLSVFKAEKDPDTSVLSCTWRVPEKKCSNDVWLLAAWSKESEFTSKLEYSFCIPPNKPNKLLDDITGLRLVHTHDDHKAYDQVYPLCQHRDCRKELRSTRCLKGTIMHLTVKHEEFNAHRNTVMSVQLIANVDSKVNRMNPKQAHEERTRYIIQDGLI